MTYEDDLHDPTIPAREVARRYGVVHSTVSRRRQLLGIKPPPPKRTDRPCDVCGKRTVAKSGTCQDCAQWAGRKPGNADALPPGRWIVNRTTRILEFWPDLHAVPEPTEEPYPTPCGKCGAESGKPCRTPRGKAIGPHAARLEPSACADCADPLDAGSLKTYCDDCRTRRKQASWRESQRRRSA